MCIKLIVLLVGILALAACGGGDSNPTAEPTVTAAPTASVTPPPTETPVLTDTIPDAFVTVVSCLEEQLGSHVARTLVSGERQETAEEQVVLEACLLASASGISDEDLSPAASACFSKRLSAEVLQMVGSGARSLTPQEEGVLVDCLVTTALDTTPSASTFEGCLQEHLGGDLALLVASRSVPLNDVETQALNACLLVSALTETEQTVEERALACLAERLGEDIAPVVASGSIPLTEAEQAALGDCLVDSSIKAAKQAAKESGSQSLDAAVSACLAERWGADIAAVVASRAIPLTEAEQAALGDCLLSSSLEISQETSTQTTEQEITACLEEKLGADIAAVVASGAIPLSAKEEQILGDCVLQAALAGSP